MSTPEQSGADSRPSKETNSVTASPADIQQSDESVSDPVAERVAEFEREYSDLADLPLSRQHGRKLRRIVTDPEWEEEYVDTDDPLENAFTVDRLASRSASTWADALHAFLKAHQDYKGLLARFADRETGEEFDVPLVDAWGEAYSKKQYARARALQRQMSGGERPSGEAAIPVWSDPATAMLTFTASSVPDGRRMPPVDFLDQVHDSFSYDGVRDTLRNVMEYHLGLSSEKWGYWLQAEPHGMGDAESDEKFGLNACYTHIHVGVYFDADVVPYADLRQVGSEFERVIDKHVAECDPATFDAHDYTQIDDYLEDTTGCISVNADVENLGSYLAAYMGGYTEALLEKPIEYLAWGAIYWSGARRRTSRSQTVNQAIRADRCRQRAEYEDSGQFHQHGDKVRWDDGNGANVVCGSCGSPWQIAQDRLSEPDRNVLEDDLRWALEVADSPVEPDRDRTLREKWPSADGAGSVGETHRKAVLREKVAEYLEIHPDPSLPEVLARLNIDPNLRSFVGGILNGETTSRSEGFSRQTHKYGWELKAIVDSDGEEHSPGGGGVDTVELKLPVSQLLQETRLRHDRKPGEMFRCGKCNFATPDSNTMAYHLIGEGLERPDPADRVLIVEDYHGHDRPCMRQPTNSTAQTCKQ